MTAYNDPIKDDFRNFLFLVWEHLGLPPPTDAQYEIAYFMQHGFPEMYSPVAGRSDIIEAFRGIGKSFAAAAFCLWRLYRDPVNEKILVVSASSTKAKEFVSQCKGILMTMALLASLRPREDQRDAFDRFDVNGASISQVPSLKAAGITGQIVGSRATLIVPDDVEIETNSRTEEARQSILKSVLEFESIKVPALLADDGTVLRPAGDVLFLGTPQTAESIYNRLIRERGYNCFCVPARYPPEDKLKSYVVKRNSGEEINVLAPYLRERMNDPALGIVLGRTPTDPKRFSDEDLLAREAKGKAYFLLQFMLDTTLSDAERYPLKQNDLIVMPLNFSKAPMTIQWGRHSDRINVRDDIPNVGFTGDYFMGPLFADKEWREYTGSVMFVDPSGRGKDETAWAVVKALNGILYVLKVGGFNGPVEEAYVKIAVDAKLYDVNLIQIEPNFAPGVWIAGFHPVLSRVWPGGKVTRRIRKDEPIPSDTTGACTVEEAEWARGMKEARIIDTLEPVINTHRLVVDEAVARDEVLMFQFTHITKERNSLAHDDRVDALAGAVAYFVQALTMDSVTAAKEVIEAELDAELEDFIESCRGMLGRARKARGRDREEVEVYTVNV